MKCHGDNYPGCLSWLVSQITHPVCRIHLFIGRAAECSSPSVTALQRMTSNASMCICVVYCICTAHYVCIGFFCCCTFACVLCIFVLVRDRQRGTKLELAKWSFFFQFPLCCLVLTTDWLITMYVSTSLMISSTLKSKIKIWTQPFFPYYGVDNIFKTQQYFLAKWRDCFANSSVSFFLFSFTAASSQNVFFYVPSVPKIQRTVLRHHMSACIIIYAFGCAPVLIGKCGML